MVKETNIILRVGGETKARIAEAARRIGKNLTGFILEATMRQVERVERTERKPSGGPCPTYFRAQCATAKAGGSSGYDRAAYELTRHLPELQPYSMDEDEWHRRLDAFEKLMDDDMQRQGDQDSILSWFDTNLPRCMDLVPPRRRDSFVAGVRKCYEDLWPLS